MSRIHLKKYIRQFFCRHKYELYANYKRTTDGRTEYVLKCEKCGAVKVTSKLPRKLRG